MCDSAITPATGTSNGKQPDWLMTKVHWLLPSAASVWPLDFHIDLLFMCLSTLEITIALINERIPLLLCSSCNKKGLQLDGDI